MQKFDRKKHWEKIYNNRDFKDSSWYQEKPHTSLQFVEQFKVPNTARIIDVGGGDSFFVDHLLDLGYFDITVLDISGQAIEKAKMRLGDRANSVKWIVTDVSNFEPENTFDFWHDRAAFHFLTKEKEVERYLATIREYIKPGGYLVIGTFSKQGPKKCSGIEIKQYSEQSLTRRLKDFFEKIKCIIVDHKTPSNTIQNFIFCSFRRSRTST